MKVYIVNTDILLSDFDIHANNNYVFSNEKECEKFYKKVVKKVKDDGKCYFRNNYIENSEKIYSSFRIYTIKKKNCGMRNMITVLMKEETVDLFK